MNSFLQGIDTAIVRVSNIEKSKTWYVETLRFSVLYEDQKIRLVVLDTGGPTSLTLWGTEEKITPNKKTSTYPIFTSQFTVALHKQLKTKGNTVSEITTDDAVTYFTFRDPDENLVEVCQVQQ